MRVTLLVSNDLTHDQRVRKVCATLLAEGHSITLVGRKLPESEPLQRPYRTIRFRLLFRKGVLFYAALNLRMFLFLLFHRTDVIHCNDLDTLLAGYLVAWLRRKEVVYDSHEYFTESEGLVGRPMPKKVWEFIERRIFPKLQYVWTVNHSIADIYKSQYHVDVKVVRNVPPFATLPQKVSRASLGLPEHKRIAILQGAFLDRDRGTKEVVMSAAFLPEDVLVVIIGSGNEMETVRELGTRPEIAPRVMIRNKMPYEQLLQFTMNADLGLIMDKDVNLNYRLSLPNKLFDYIRAGIPILATNLPELSRIVKGENIGTTFDSHEPASLAQSILSALEHSDRKEWYENLKTAGKTFTWENEEEVILKTYREIAKRFNSSNTNHH